MLAALTRAFYWQHLLDDSVLASGDEIAQREGQHHSTVVTDRAKGATR
ncbi:MAG: hypothetical protein ACKOWD_00200 [Rhodoferax sp.]